MQSFRVGLNKGFGIALLVLAAFHVFAFSILHSAMPLVFGLLWILVGLMYLLGPCFVIEQSSDGGEVLVKNPFGMTLKRHAFGQLSDLSVEGRKLVIKTLDGTVKRLGGVVVDGTDMARLTQRLSSASTRGQSADRGPTGY
jgi:hypothetical protein